MRRTLLFAFAAALTAGTFTAAAQDSSDAYRRPLKPRGFTARAVVLPPRKIGDSDVRAESTMAVEVLVDVQDFLPRALEPVLLIDGKPVKSRSRVVKVEGDITTLGFTLDKPAQLKDDAKLSVQMGEEEQTRARVPGELRLERITPLDKGEAERLKLPTLSDWLKDKP